MHISHTRPTFAFWAVRDNHRGSELLGWNLRDDPVQNLRFTGKNLRPWLNFDCYQSPLELNCAWLHFNEALDLNT